jgi:hypothetical protein
MLSLVMLNVVLLNVANEDFTMSVVMLNVVLQSVVTPLRKGGLFFACSQNKMVVPSVLK